jgi:TolB-like protein
MDVAHTVVEWFNGLVGLQYAGYGPITAIGIGIVTMLMSIKLIKLCLKPFAPLFMDDEGPVADNPVLAQQGIRHSQLMSADDEFGYSDALPPDTPAQAAANDAGEMEFSDALEEAWQDDQSQELQAEIAPLRPIPSHATIKGAEDKHSMIKPTLLRRIRATAGAGPEDQEQVAKSCEATPSTETAMPLVRITGFDCGGRSSGAAQRMATRFGQGIGSTLARIPNLRIESGDSDLSAEPAFLIEGKIELKRDGVHVSLAVRDSSDGSHLMAREMTCGPAQMHDLEKEAALEIAAAVIANYRISNQVPAQAIPQRGAASFIPRVLRRGFGQDGQSEKTYPSARRPSAGRLHRTDQPAQ